MKLIFFDSFIGTNDCSYSGSKPKCDFLCLPAGANNHSCECPEGLRKIGSTCKCPTGQTLVGVECHPGKKSSIEIKTR